MNLFYLLILVASLSGIIGLILWLRLQGAESKASQQAKKLVMLEERLSQQQTNFRRLDELITELRSGFYGLSDKVKLLQQDQSQERSYVESSVENLAAKFHELESADPGSRLYSKAAKLIASGASIEDVMQECELPRAEAELMMNLHSKQE